MHDVELRERARCPANGPELGVDRLDAGFGRAVAPSRATTLNWVA
jgi:hypothetical protein